MKSLRSTGRSTAARAACRCSGDALEMRPVGQHRQAGRAAVRDRPRASAAGSKSGADQPAGGRGLLDLGDQRRSRPRPPPPSARSRTARRVVAARADLALTHAPAACSRLAVASSRRASSAQMLRQHVGSRGCAVSCISGLHARPPSRAAASPARRAPRPIVDRARGQRARPRADRRPGPRRSARRRRSAAPCRDMGRWRLAARPAAPRRSARRRRRGSPRSGARGRPASSGATVKLAHLAVLPAPTTWFSPATVSSSRPWPCTTQARSRARAGPASRPSARAHSGANTPVSWRRTRAGLASGPSRLKIVRVPSSTRGPAAWRIDGWWRGANRKAQSAARRMSGSRSSGTSTLTPSAASTSAPPVRDGQRAVAVLGHRHAAAGHDEGHGGGDVQRAGGVAAGAADVDRVRRAPRPRSSARAWRAPRR